MQSSHSGEGPASAGEEHADGVTFPASTAPTSGANETVERNGERSIEAVRICIAVAASPIARPCRAIAGEAQKAWPSLADEGVLPQVHLEEVELTPPERCRAIEYNGGEEAGR